MICVGFGVSPHIPHRCRPPERVGMFFVCTTIEGNMGSRLPETGKMPLPFLGKALLKRYCALILAQAPDYFESVQDFKNRIRDHLGTECSRVDTKRQLFCWFVSNPLHPSCKLYHVSGRFLGFRFI